MTDNNDDIKVNDKRRFKLNEDKVEENVEVSSKQDKDETEDTLLNSNSEKIDTSEEDNLQNSNLKITFIDLINSLAGTTLIQLGAVADPQTNVIKKDLNAAKQTIDILEILKEKTTGNLNNEESMMLDNVLFDLRMRYVLIAEGKK